MNEESPGASFGECQRLYMCTRVKGYLAAKLWMEGISDQVNYLVRDRNA